MCEYGVFRIQDYVNNPVIKIFIIWNWDQIAKEEKSEQVIRIKENHSYLIAKKYYSNSPQIYHQGVCVNVCVLSSLLNDSLQY